MSSRKARNRPGAPRAGRGYKLRRRRGVRGEWGAAIFHGSAHVTNDLDICYSRDKGTVGKLEVALKPHHPRPRGFPDDLPFVTDLGIIDHLAEVVGIGIYDEARKVSV